MTSDSLPLSGIILRPPKYCCQRSPGRADRAYVRINGKKVMLSTYDSAESFDRYFELIGGRARGDQRPVGPHTANVPRTSPITVSELLVQYLTFARDYYPQRNGRKSEFDDIKHVMRLVRKVAGATLAQEFGPKILKQIREEMIASDHSRRYINKNCGRIRRMFRWAVEEELVSPSVHMALSAVRGLQPGRTKPVRRIPFDRSRMPTSKPLSSTCRRWWPPWSRFNG